MRSKYLNVPTHRGKASKNATFESVTSMLLDSLGIFYCKKYTCTTSPTCMLLLGSIFVSV